MHATQKKGLIILASTNFVVFILFFIPFLLTKNFWFLTASLINILAMIAVIYLAIKLNKSSNDYGQK